MYRPLRRIKRAKYFLHLVTMKEMRPTTPEMIPKLLHSLYRKVRSLEKAVKRSNPMPSRKKCCSSSLKKCELALLFYILMDEGIFFFDEYDDVKNRNLMQHFLEKNFSYRGDGGEQAPLKSVTREFSEAKGYTYSEKQRRLLDRFIQKLEIRKQHI